MKDLGRIFSQRLSVGWQSLKLAWDASPSLSVLILPLTCISSATPLGIVYVGKLIIDAVVARSEQQVIHYALAEFGLVLLQTMVFRANGLAKTLLSQKLALDVTIQILEKATKAKFAQLEDSVFYDKLSKAWRESSSRPLQMVNEFLLFLQNALTLSGYAALLISFSIWAVVIMFVASVPAAFIEIRFSQKNFRLINWRSPERRRLSYLEGVLAGDTYAKESKILGLGRLLLDRYTRLGRGFYQEDKDLSIKRTSWAAGLSTFSIGAFYACYLAVAIMTVRGKLTVGSLTMYTIAFRQSQQAFQACLASIGTLYEHNLYMTNLFDFLSIPTGRAQASASSRARATPDHGGIRFEEVSFTYPGRELPALSDISFDVPVGGSVAIVGHNGAGKSTLVKLACGLYEPSKGRILLQGRDLREWDREELWHALSVVFQDFNRYQFSLRENVGLGAIVQPSRSIDPVHPPYDDAEIREAIEKAGATEMSRELSAGLNSQLGRMFDGGAELSGGQWQKLALARAFMRSASPFLVLDEPTSALDAEAERALFARFNNLLQGKTSILISHKLPTARLADRIVVIDQGRVTEQGTHEELLAAVGRYHDFFSAQAKGYE